MPNEDHFTFKGCASAANYVEKSHTLTEDHAIDLHFTNKAIIHPSHYEPRSIDPRVRGSERADGCD